MNIEVGKALSQEDVQALNTLLQSASKLIEAIDREDSFSVSVAVDDLSACVFKVSAAKDPIRLMRTSEDNYVGAELKMQREYGKSPNGNALNGMWVLRHRGVWIDFDRYQNDLAERYNLQID